MKGFLSLLAAGALFGLSGPLASLLSDSFSAYETVFLRFSIAAVTILAVSAFLKNKIVLSGVKKRDLAFFSLTYPVQVIFFVLSIFSTKVVLAIFTFYIADTITSFVLGRILLKEKVNLAKAISLLLLFTSLLFITNIFQEFSLEIGLIFGLLSGVSNGFASYYKKKLSKRLSPLNLTVLQTVTGALVGIIAVIGSGQFFESSISSIDIGTVVIYGIIFLVLTYLLIYGFKNFDLNIGSIVVSSELLFGPLFAFALIGEQITSMEIVGGIFVIVSILLPNIEIFSRKLTGLGNNLA